MTTGAALEFLVLEQRFTDVGGTANIRLRNHEVGRRLDLFIVKIVQNPSSAVDG